ncbi:MAG: calcineurin-like phosphoesterase family protein [Planctomycetaceae bacterium]|jgi:hypothetical protein|nr:calcineurin-like phosphoesterase family protein [Planctomycetaceae bacterium]
MKKWLVLVSVVVPLALAAVSGPAAPPGPEFATGVVFHDSNGNRKFDAKEKPLAGVRVSNGREIVKTDKGGRYRLPVDDDTILFVIKSRGWRTPFSDHMLPQFYYIHKPHGSPDLRYAGVKPTGPLPDSIDFPLYPQREPDTFKALMFGDPQPRDQKEIDYVTHDVLEELIGTDASLGVTLGDIMFNDLTLFGSQSRAIALLGIPWYNVIGNHDINTDARSRRHVNETFERVFGPSYYSFDYGTVHFLVVDDVDWLESKETGNWTYRGGLGKRQMEFIRNDLAMIPENQLVVLMMHIPLIDVEDRQELYRLIEKRPFCLSISGHTHHHEHRFITGKDGWRGPEPHHHIINVTVCGSWWSGAPDERGIPHTTMSDGAPNGYSILTFDGHKYTVDFKAARRPVDYQMNILAPEAVTADKAGQADVYVNVFNGSEKSKVEMRVGKTGRWITMDRKVINDPAYEKILAAEQAAKDKSWRDLPKPKKCPHLWHTTLPEKLEVGVHGLHIRTTDMHGRIYHGHRVIRITGAAAKPAAGGSAP